MRLQAFVNRFHSMVSSKNFDPNVLRLGVLTTLIGVTGLAVFLAAITSCKSTSRSKITSSQGQDVASDASKIKEENSSANELPTKPVLPDPSVALPLSSEDPARTDDEAVDGKLAASMPVVGLEVWQDNKPVSTIVTGKQVTFKLSGDTREMSLNGANGCADNPGIIQASWTIGSKPAADVQRFAGQDCRALDYGGMFTKEGSITVKLDVLTVDGEVASSQKTFDVRNVVN